MASVFQVSAELGAEFTGEAAFDEAVEAATALQAGVTEAEKQVASLGDAMVVAKRAADDAAGALAMLKAQSTVSAEALAAASGAADRTKVELIAAKRAAEDAATALTALKKSGTASAESLAEAAGASDRAKVALVEAKRAAQDAADALKTLKASGGVSAEAMAAAATKAETAKQNLAALKRAAEDAAVGLTRAKTAAADGTARLRDLEAQAGATAARTKDVATRAGDMDTALKGVAGAIGVVSPQMETLLMRTGDVVGGFEALWKGSEALGVGLGGVGLALGAVAVAAAAAVTVYSQFAVEQERAADAGGRTAERLKEVKRVGDLADETLRKLATSGSAFSGVLDGISDRARVASGELQSVIDAENAVSGIRAASSPELLALGQKQASLSGQASAAGDRLRQASAAGDEEGVVKAREEAQKLSAELATVTDKLTKQREAVERAIDTEEMLREKARLEAEQREKDAEALRKGAEATRRRAEADRKAEQEAAKLAAEQERAVAAMIANTDGMIKWSATSAGTIAAIEALAPALTDAERAFVATNKQLDDLAAGLGAAALSSHVSGEELKRYGETIAAARVKAEEDLAAAKADAEKKAAEDAKKGAEEAQKGAEQSASNATQVIGGIVSGSLSSALQPLFDSLGPKGAIAGAVLGLLEQGPEQVTAIIDALPGLVGSVIDTVMGLIDTLPETLVSLIDGIVAKIPELLLAVFSLVYGPFALEIMKGLYDATPEIITGLIVGLTELAFQLPGILFDTARMVPMMLQSYKQIMPLLREQMLAAIPDLIDGGKAMLSDLGRDFRREIIADAAALLSREGRRNRRNEDNLIKRMKGALTVDLDGRQVSRGLDKTADARKGGEGRRNG